MPNQNLGSRYVPQGVNRGNESFIETSVAVAAQNDTLTITLPDGVDKSLIPVNVTAVHTASPLTYRTAVLTSYNPTTGVCVVTVTDAAGLSAGDRVILRLIGG